MNAVFNRSLSAALVLAALAAPASAQKMLLTTPTLTPAAAYKAASAALVFCQQKGYLAGVTVADRSGIPLVFLRDQLAGVHTIAVSKGKARTAASFRTATSELAAATQAGQPESGIRNIPGVVMIGGGLPIEAGGKLVGAIGVSGAPGGAADDECAKAGIAAIQDDLEFESQ